MKLSEKRGLDNILMESQMEATVLLMEDLVLLMEVTVLLMEATVLLMEDLFLQMEATVLQMEDLVLLMEVSVLLMEVLALLMEEVDQLEEVYQLEEVDQMEEGFDQVEKVDQLGIPIYRVVRGTLISDVARRRGHVLLEVETATEIIIVKGVLSVVQTTVGSSTLMLIEKWTVVHTRKSSRQGIQIDKIFK